VIPRVRAWITFILGCSALLPGSALSYKASGDDRPRFDAIDCLALAADPRAPGNGTVLLNRCDQPVALLVVVCNLAVQPACKADPILSKGWSAHRGIEYVAPVPPRTSTFLLEASRKDSTPLAPYASGLRKGWRAQIAACRFNPEAALSQDPCVLRLSKLKRFLDTRDGMSMRAALRLLKWQ
jgi:hypothetical protein